MKRIFMMLVAAFMLFPVTAHGADAGILYFSGPQSVTAGQNLTISIIADPKGQTLDTVRSVIKFSKDTLEVKSAGLASAFSVADPDNYYSNADGIVSYTGGIPGGTAQSATFATIIFTAKKGGNASVAFDSQSIMLNGGVNMLVGFGPAFNIAIAEPPALPKNSKPQALSTAPKNDMAADAIAAIGEPEIISSVKQNKAGIIAYATKNIWFIAFWLLFALNLAYLLRKKILFLKKTALGLILFGLVAAAPVALGKTANGVSVYPSKETVILAPSKGVKKYLLIVNSSNEPMPLKVTVSDVRTTDQSGGIAFYAKEDGFSATRWLFPQYEAITVKPLDSVKVEYIVSATKDMPGKGYAGAIMFTLYDFKNNKPLGEPFGALVNLNVLAKGITTGGAIKSFNNPLLQFINPAKLNFTVENPSNSNLSLNGMVAFRSVFGREVGKFKTGQLDISPGAARTFKFEWSEAPIFGAYVGHVTLNDNLRKDNIIKSWTVIIYLPWQRLLLILLGSAAAVAVAVLFWRARAKKNRLNISLKEALVQTGNDVRSSIALAAARMRFW